MTRRNEPPAAGLESVPDSSPVELKEVRRIREKARSAEAVNLKLAGLSYEQIADRLEISQSGVQDLVGRYVRSTRLPAEEIVVMRGVENARLDRAQLAIWPQVLAGDHKAIDLYLRINTARRRMNGLDAPVEINLAVTVRQEMEQALAQLEQAVLGNTIIGEVIRDHGTTGTDGS